MSVSCCDPLKEPPIVDPNEWAITAQEWVRVSVAVPSLITPQEQPLGRLIAFPRRFPPGAPQDPARYSPENGISLLLPSAGEYSIFYDAVDPRPMALTTFDSRDPSATEIYHKDGYFQPTHTPITLGAGSTPVIPEAIQDRYRLFVNASANPIYISLGVPAAIGTGIYLQANGGSYEQYRQSLWRGRVFAAGTPGDIILATQGI